MKRSFSMLGCLDIFDRSVIDLLKKYHINYIDVVPTRFWPEWNSNSAAIELIKSRLDDCGLHAAGMQSLFFGRPGLNVFGDDSIFKNTIYHFNVVADIAIRLGCSTVTLGSPSVRVPPKLPESALLDVANERFRIIGDVCKQHDITLCIEPVPRVSGGHWLVSTDETISFVRQLSHSAVRVNLDTAVLAHEGGLEFNDWDLVAHVHASSKELRPLAFEESDLSGLFSRMRDAHYPGFVALEMLPVERKDILSKSLEVFSGVTGL